MSADTRPRDKRGRFTSPRFVWDDDGRVIRARSQDGCVFKYRYDGNPGPPPPSTRGEAGVAKEEE